MATFKSLSKLHYCSPIVVILGSTGTGKSKLAIEIAKRFNGEIINADAMQLYKGLDVITNKVTSEEQQGIQHHLLGFLNPFHNLVVYEYRNLALQAIKEVIDRKKLPIIVGGTFYYVESILYDFVIGPAEINNETKDSVEKEASSSKESEEENLGRKRLKLEDYENLVADYNKLDNEKLHEKLREVDPELAEKLHPNTRRKVLRGLTAYLQYGETLSSIFQKQRSQPGGCAVGGPLRFKNSVLLWLQCNADVLNSRLDDRVDDMLSRGLVNELLEFCKTFSPEQLELLGQKDKQRGVFQSIGLKEFYELLILDEEKRRSEEGKKLLEKGVESLKIATRQYAKRQVKWILNRFLRNGQRQVPPMYGLDVTDISKWKENVYNIAEDIIESHLAGKKPSAEPLFVEDKKEAIDKIYKCECGVTLLGRIQYETHLKSKNHSRRMKRKKLLENEETSPEDKELSVHNT